MKAMELPFTSSGELCFFILHLIMVPCFPSMAVANVMMTSFTPASTAARAFSILGTMPPPMVPSAWYFSKSARVMTGITLFSSSGLESTPFFSKQ